MVAVEALEEIALEEVAFRGEGFLLFGFLLLNFLEVAAAEGCGFEGYVWLLIDFLWLFLRWDDFGVERCLFVSGYWGYDFLS